jgi:hypothetical protein
MLMFGKSLKIFLKSALLVTLAACSPNEANPKGQASKKESYQHGEKLYREYLAADVKQAYQKARAILVLFKGDPDGADYTSYVRLHFIEYICGDKAQAQLSYERARDSYVVFLRSLQLSPEKMSRKVAEFTPEAARIMNLEWDKKSGGLPRFLKLLSEEQRARLPEGWK